MTSRQREWQIERKAKGRCITCGRKRKQRPDGSFFNADYCERCRKKRIDTQRNARARRAPAVTE